MRRGQDKELGMQEEKEIAPKCATTIFAVSSWLQIFAQFQLALVSSSFFTFLLLYGLFQI